MNALASALEISAKIVRETNSEVFAREQIWIKIIEIKSRDLCERNSYVEQMLRGYFAILKVLGAPEVL